MYLSFGFSVISDFNICCLFLIDNLDLWMLVFNILRFVIMRFIWLFNKRCINWYLLFVMIVLIFLLLIMVFNFLVFLYECIILIGRFFIEFKLLLKGIWFFFNVMKDRFFFGIVWFKVSKLFWVLFKKLLEIILFLMKYLGKRILVWFNLVFLIVWV